MNFVARDNTVGRHIDRVACLVSGRALVGVFSVADPATRSLVRGRQERPCVVISGLGAIRVLRYRKAQLFHRVQYALEKYGIGIEDLWIT